MFCKAFQHYISLKTLFQYPIQQQHSAAYILREHMVNQAEVIVSIEQVELLHGIGIGKLACGDAGYSVEHTKCIAHTAFSLLRYDVQCSFLRLHTLFGGYTLQVGYYVAGSYPFKIEYLATAEF